MTDDRRRTADKFRWLDQVGADHSLTPLCFRLAYAISTYVNRTTGDAWPSQPRLAADCNATDRAIRDAITRLRDRGHMEVTGKGGRGKTSRFRPVIMSAEKRKDTSTLLPAKAEEDFRVIPPKPGRKRLKTRKKTTDKRGSLLPTIPLIEPIEETIERKSLPMINQSRSDFEAFWHAYPKKVDKLRAEKLFANLLKSKRASVEQLIAGANRYATERAGQDPTYTKHASTWLNAGGWLDEPQPSRSTGNESIMSGLASYCGER
jgi:hypothetical protein